MFSTTDTIVAIATPAGRGALGIVRLSGPSAQSIAAHLLGRAQALQPRHATFAQFRGDDVHDQVVATFFNSPHSYTGDDIVEISAHGSSVVLRSIVMSAVDHGARLAQPGEFTLRAYLNGKLDLVQAEAVGDLIDAVTPLQARAAFDQLNGTLTTEIRAIEGVLFDLIARLEASVDFPDEGYHFIEPAHVEESIRDLMSRIDRLLRSASRGRLIREGAQVVIAGRPNAGKSRLFNALVGAHRAIVSDRPGTTRDLLSEVVDLNGVRITLVDTAGLTDSDDPVEREGVKRAGDALIHADLVLHVVDGSVPLEGSEDRLLGASDKCLLVSSKSDLPRACELPGSIAVSAETGSGLDRLVDAISNELVGEDKAKDTPAISNVRHISLLNDARDALLASLEGIGERGGSIAEELLLVDLQSARSALEQVSGRRTPDDLLNHVFANFCIGK